MHQAHGRCHFTPNPTILRRLHPDTEYKQIHGDISLCMVPVNHGKCGGGTYESAAFFIRHDPTHAEFLFFGDVEPDSIAIAPQNINIWRLAAPRIPTTLSAIFIECSWPSGRPDSLLYGHMSPEHLVAELEVLATEVIRARDNLQLGHSPSATHSLPPARKRQKTTNLDGALSGLCVYVMHCKDDMDCDQPMNRVIVDQVRALVASKRLGAEIVAAEQGMRIGMFFVFYLSFSLYHVRVNS
jgi:cAMP phosphodiesterase